MGLAPQPRRDPIRGRVQGAVRSPDAAGTRRSNRSAALLQLSKVQKALADAEACIKLRPTWEKGYFRKGSVLEGMEKAEEALEAYREAAELNPKNLEVGAKIKILTKMVRKSKNASGKLPKAENFVKSDEEYTAAKENLAFGADIPHSEKRARAFGKECVDAAINLFVEQGASLEPVVITLPGKLDGEGKEVQGRVSVKNAFDSPDVLQNCVTFLRKFVGDTHAAAACVIVPRRSISFPQVWMRKGGKKKWKFGDKPGVFVQLESKELQGLWFLLTKAGVVPDSSSAQPLDVDTFRLIPPLYK